MTEVMHVDKNIIDANSETSASEWQSSDSDSPDKDYDADSEKETQDGNLEEKHSGLATVMSKILNKKVPKHQKTILVKAKTERELQKLRKQKEGKDSEDEDLFEKSEKKKLWENMGRIKPQVLDKEREKYLQRIATRGVVQLFNAVRKQQRIMSDRLVEVGPSVRRRDKVLESMTKGKFLDLLKGTSSPSVVNIDKLKEEEIKEEPADAENNEKWSILRDDFMMGANMKDWDKEISEDEGGGQEVMDDDEDDDDDDDDVDMSNSE